MSIVWRFCCIFLRLGLQIDYCIVLQGKEYGEKALEICSSAKQKDEDAEEDSEEEESQQVSEIKHLLQIISKLQSYIKQ